MSNLKYFTEKTDSNNIDRFLNVVNNTDEITIGAENIHDICLPFSTANEEDFLPLIEKMEMIYTQGNSNYIIEILPEHLIKLKNNNYVAEIILSTKFTNQFKLNSMLDVIGQLKVTLNTGEIYYDRPYKVKLISPAEKLVEAKDKEEGE